jgi:hypothetical protein
MVYIICPTCKSSNVEFDVYNDIFCKDCDMTHPIYRVAWVSSIGSVYTHTKVVTQTASTATILQPMV